MSSRQKVEAILAEIRDTYEMSFGHFLLEFFRYNDVAGEPLSRSRLHTDALKDILRGHTPCYSLAYILKEILNDPMAYPKRGVDKEEAFSPAAPYPMIAASALSTMVTELARTRRLAYMDEVSKSMLVPYMTEDLDSEPLYMVPSVSKCTPKISWANSPLQQVNPSPMMRMHDIGLQLIFDVLTPSAEDLSPTPYRGPDSLWAQRIRTWKAVALVSRRWNLLANPYLYRYVGLRRVGQLLALVRTLKSTDGFGDMIKHLSFSCFVPNEWDSVTNESISYLLTKCPNIHSLSLMENFSQWLHTFRQDGTRRCQISDETIQAATSITDVSYCYIAPNDVANLSQYHVFSSLPNITSLTLNMEYPSSPSYLTCLFDLQQGHLDEIRANPAAYQDLPFLQGLDPRLKHLRIDGGLWFRDRCHIISQRLLHLNLFERFTNLHLVIDDHYNMEGKAITGRLDVWKNFEYPCQGGSKFYACFCEQPSTPGLRFLHRHLRHFLPNLPFTFPPDAIDHDSPDEDVHNFFRTRLRVASDVVTFSTLR